MATTVPGLNLPTQTAMLAGNPRDSAIAAQTAANNKLMALNNAVGGMPYRHAIIGHSVKRNRRYHYTRKHSRRKRGRRHCRCMCPCYACRNECKYRRNKRCHRARGGANTIQVPQFTMQYTPTGGPGQTPNDLIKQNSQISTQAAANAVYDKYAYQK